MWICALALGAICIGFAVIATRSHEAPAKPLRTVAPCADAGSGLGVGLAFGAIVGAGLGYLAGRVHSSRKSP
ncbi:MAG TPA: hypothetical protein VGM88_29295 [Kofleriaceae bacterium]|jgi:hypothetical protein